MLVFSTTKAAVVPAASKAAAAGLISYHVAALTQGVLRTMLIAKLKMIGGMVLAAAVIAGGARLAVVRTVAGEQIGTTVERAQPPVAGKADPDRVKLLVDQLGSSRFADREKASKELDDMGGLALDALRLAVKGDEPEAQTQSGDAGSEDRRTAAKSEHADAQTRSFGVCRYASGRGPGRFQKEKRL